MPISLLSRPTNPRSVLHGQQVGANHPSVVTQAAADWRDDVRPSDVGEQSAALGHPQAHDVRVRIDESVYRFRDRVGRFSDHSRSCAAAFALRQRADPRERFQQRTVSFDLVLVGDRPGSHELVAVDAFGHVAVDADNCLHCGRRAGRPHFGPED
jgi:hypothetical protein